MRVLPPTRPLAYTPLSGPRVITGYHASGAMFDQFQPSARGTFGAGIYAGDMDAAKVYAQSFIPARLYEVEMTFQNAFYYEAQWDDEIDSPAVDLVRQLFEPAEADMLLSMLAASSDCHFGNEIMERLRALGYDGLVARYEADAFEFLAFEPSQVEILSIITL